MSEQVFIKSKIVAAISIEFLITDGACVRTCCRKDIDRSPILEGV
jgi:hypothetical protein